MHGQTRENIMLYVGWPPKHQYAPLTVMFSNVADSQLSFTVKVGTCESTICVRIKSRIESRVKIRI